MPDRRADAPLEGRVRANSATSAIRRRALASIFWMRLVIVTAVILSSLYWAVVGDADLVGTIGLFLGCAAWVGAGWLIKRESLAAIVVTAVVNAMLIVVPLLTMPPGRVPHGAEVLVIPMLPAGIELVAIAFATVAAMLAPGRQDISEP